MPPVPLVDPTSINLSTVLYDIEAIRLGNPQRFEMEQLTAIVHVNYRDALIIGYKDVGADEFWTRGHLPGDPLLPGVLICEAAAQLCSFYCCLPGLVTDSVLGFGGLEEVRFRKSVRPGDRLVLVGKGERLRGRQKIFATQAFVGPDMVFHARILGVPLPGRATDPTSSN